MFAFGENKTLVGWAKDSRCQVSQPTLSERLQRGMTLEEAITTPPTRNNGAAKNVAKVGDEYGKLTIIEGPWMAPKGKQQASKVKCRCECGKEVEVFVNALRGTEKKKTVSCGCWKAEKASQRMTEANLSGMNVHPTHNMSRTRLYRLYHEMKNRCYYKNHASFSNYGGRGITVCDEWKQSFESFANWAMENGYDDDLTIERKNYNGNYEPTNCTFATMKQQANNTRRNNRVQAFGEEKTLALWAEDQRCVVDYNTLRYRVLYYGWSSEEAITTPSIRKLT